MTVTETLDCIELLGSFEPESLQPLHDSLVSCIESICNRMEYMKLVTLKRNKDSPANPDITAGTIATEGSALLMQMEGVDVESVSVWISKTEELIRTIKNNDNREEHQSTTYCKLVADILEDVQQNSRAVRRLLSAIRSNISLSMTDGHSMSFRWSDSQLLQAMERGDWLLMRHVHFATPAVLDRLNSLLEPNGK